MGKSILICGSMTHWAAMRALAAKLVARGFDAQAPADERPHAQIDRIALKRLLSERYFRLIRRRGTAAILVANYAKHGKPIYLLNDLYPPLKDELRAWGAIPLKGNLDCLTA